MAKRLAVLLGIIFVVVGLLGFIPNPLVGHNGYFVTNTVHDFTCILVGVILLVFSTRSEYAAKLAFYGIGTAYVLTLLGFAQVGGPVQDLLLGVVLVIGGLVKKHRPDALVAAGGSPT